MRGMDAQQENFLRDDLFNCTVRGAFQRAHVYKAGAEENGKENFRRALRSSLEQLEAQYREPVNDEDHIRNIETLSRELSADHAEVLVDGRFRIGIAQKALNLYLKYLWCIGKVSTPPHCPFDAHIIGELPDVSDNWTRMDSLERYRKWVSAAKEKAGPTSLARWELEIFPRLFQDRSVDVSGTHSDV
jgi:hypothetical protein